MTDKELVRIIIKIKFKKIIEKTKLAIKNRKDKII